MGRMKSKRMLHFKPFCKNFAPTCKKPNGIKTLHHDEIEALYLMDIVNMYQKEAAKKMEISRPTFTRILKNARIKVTSAIVSGYELKIEDIKTSFNLAICSNDKNNFSNTTPLDKQIFLYRVQKGVVLKEILQNPANETDRPAHIFPKLFMQKNINVFVSSKINDGLKYALIAKGIESRVMKECSEEDFKGML